MNGLPVGDNRGDPGWSNGKTRAFGALDGGSIPPPGTDEQRYPQLNAPSCVK